MLPPDSHVHSEWSWDALAGGMDATCARAVSCGIPLVTFTEHADFTTWSVPTDAALPPGWESLVVSGLLVPPLFDREGYQACLDRCRTSFPTLRILSGVELSEPHWHEEHSASLLAAGQFDRVLAAVHSAPNSDGGFVEFSSRFLVLSPQQVVRDYLAEVARMVASFKAFEILAHIDYPVRNWPAGAKPYDPNEFEREYRQVLALLAAAEKVLEVNTKVPLHAEVVRWWRDEGGQAISFASDAHGPAELAHGFDEATRMAQSVGFGPGGDPNAFWTSS